MTPTHAVLALCGRSHPPKRRKAGISGPKPRKKQHPEASPEKHSKAEVLRREPGGGFGGVRVDASAAVCCLGIRSSTLLGLCASGLAVLCTVNYVEPLLPVLASISPPYRLEAAHGFSSFTTDPVDASIGRGQLTRPKSLAITSFRRASASVLRG